METRGPPRQYELCGITLTSIVETEKGRTKNVERTFLEEEYYVTNRVLRKSDQSTGKFEAIDDTHEEIYIDAGRVTHIHYTGSTDPGVLGEELDRTISIPFHQYAAWQHPTAILQQDLVTPIIPSSR